MRSAPKKEMKKLSDLIKSKQRVADHGEVFTPSWLVDKMLDLVKAETERIDSRFLEPACGSGNFLLPVLKRKLAAVDKKYKSSEFERMQQAILGLMCIYGIELLKDNAEECRNNLLEVFCSHLKIEVESLESKAAKVVLKANIVQGDALSLKNHEGEPIVFPEWSYIGKGLFKRRDFKYDELLQLSSFGEGTLFESLGAEEIFAPIKDYPAMNLSALTQIVEGSK
jgi:hypothetical protein